MLFDVIWCDLLHDSSSYAPTPWLTRISRLNQAGASVPTAGLRLGERLLLGLRKRFLAIARCGDPGDLRSDGTVGYFLDCLPSGKLT